MKDSAAPLATARSVWPLQLAVGVLLALKLVFYGFAPPLGDEAYYWLWGQRPALSYLDHPPLHAWLLGISSRLFGWNLFSLRALTWLTLAGTIWVIWVWSKRLAPGDPRTWFWTALAVYLASPLMFVMGSISFNDHLLVVLCLLSAHFFLDFAEAWRAGGTTFGKLYLAAVLLGLALLTKYNAALLAVGYLLFVLLDAELRPLLRRWQTYAATGLSVLLQAPVIAWNLADGLASYRFHLSERWGGTMVVDPVNLVLVVAMEVVTLSVFLIVPLLRLYGGGGGSGFERSTRKLAAIMLGLSSLTVMAIALIETEVAPYWNILAYPIGIPLLVRGFRTRTLFSLHVVTGTALIALFTVNLLVAPVRNYLGWRDATTYSNYDWPRIAQIVTAEHDKYPQAFLAATRYTTAAQLGFALHDANVTDISDRHTEFDYWFDPGAHRGQDGLVLAAPFIPPDYARTQFHSLALLRTIDVVRFGVTVGTYQLYLGKDYCAGSCLGAMTDDLGEHPASNEHSPPN